MGGRPARSRAGPSAQAGAAWRARPRHRRTDRACQRQQAQHRFHRSAGKTRPPLWTEAWTQDRAGRAGISKLTRAALALRPWLTIEWLPRYALELNDIERSWRDLKRHFLAHRTFQSVEHSKRPSTKPSSNSTMKGSTKCATINESLLGCRDALGCGVADLPPRSRSVPSLVEGGPWRNLAPVPDGAVPPRSVQSGGAGFDLRAILAPLCDARQVELPSRGFRFRGSHSGHSRLCLRGAMQPTKPRPVMLAGCRLGTSGSDEGTAKASIKGGPPWQGLMTPL